ncbi:hypothetical protein KIL84_000810 [Mauremys mutica]|uniref:Uncharacterized protein n=1 Tax=Mauremys mutica TaxID=74926 RepID=A0A9D3WZG1_9SAUR|nr:hypothetical protein KIL84_000810 [Mauremys mutica]
METLKCKPDQGKAFELTSKWDSSNHFLTGGGFTHFANWRFIHRAQINCILLNGAVHHRNRDKRCRKCAYSNEPHVLYSFSFENRTPAFREGHACKLEKYAPLADILRTKGYEVQMDVLIIRALGTWDPCNVCVPRTSGIGRHYAQLMWRLMVSDTI